jgi:hypothetical protein
MKPTSINALNAVFFMAMRALANFRGKMMLTGDSAQNPRSMGAMASRVENRRSNCSLPVVNRLGFRFVASIRLGLVLFPVPAHRTGQADFPHPALGKDTRCSV